MKKKTIGYVIANDHADGDTYYYTTCKNNSWVWAGGIKNARVFTARKEAVEFASYGRGPKHRIIRYFRWVRDTYEKKTHKQLAKMVNDLEWMQYRLNHFIKRIQRNEKLRKAL